MRQNGSFYAFIKLFSGPTPSIAFKFVWVVVPGHRLYCSAKLVDKPLRVALHGANFRRKGCNPIKDDFTKQTFYRKRLREAYPRVWYCDIADDLAQLPTQI